MTTSTEARPIIIEALKLELGHSPTLAEVYIAQAVARFDGGYGNYPSPPNGPEGPTSNNWGAVQHPDLPKYRVWRGSVNPNKRDPVVAKLLSVSPPPSPKPKEWFYASDFYPPSKGGKGWFWGPYRVYPNPVDGARHTIHILKTMGVLDVGNSGHATWNDVARKMYDGHYFTGYDSDKEKAIREYAANLADGGNAFAKLFGERSPILDPKAPPAAVVVDYSSPPVSLPVLRIGSHGEAVDLWQRLIGAPRTGKFDQTTKELTMAWQLRSGLKDDGVVGPKTWGAVLC